MKNIAKALYEQGYNCCEAIVMAADRKYNLKLDKQSLKLAAGLNNGVGIGGLCGGIIGGVMVIGYIFQHKVAPEHSKISHIRMKFIDDVNAEFKSVNCCKIKALPIASQDCVGVVSKIAEILENTIKCFSI